MAVSEDWKHRHLGVTWGGVGVFGLIVTAALTLQLPVIFTLGMLAYIFPGGYYTAHLISFGAVAFISN